MRYYLIIIGCTLLQPLCLHAQTGNMTVDRAFQALQQKDKAKLVLCLSDSCKMAGLDSRTMRDVLPEVVSAFAGFDGFQKDTSYQEQGGQRIKLAIHYLNGNMGHPDVLVDKTGRITELNIIRNPKVRHTGNELPAHVTLPFQLINERIFVKGSMNGQAGLFEIDSGAFGLIANDQLMPALVNEQSETVKRAVVNGINGKVPDARSATIDIDIEGIHLRSAPAVVLSMPALQLTRDTPILGLIGYSLLRNYELTFDYRARSLTLDKTDAQGNTARTDRHFSKRRSVPFSMQRHLPVLQTKIAGISYFLALDCGASHNVLYSINEQEIRSQFKGLTKKLMAGIGDQQQEVLVGDLRSLTCGTISFKLMPTVLSENASPQAGQPGALKIDGILGAPFLRQYITIVNYQKAEISFIDR